MKESTRAYLRANWDESQLLPIILNRRPAGSFARLAGKHRCLVACERIEQGLESAEYRLPAYVLHLPIDEEAGWRKRHEEAVGKSKWSNPDYWAMRLLVDPKARNLNERVAALGFEIVGASQTENRRQLKSHVTVERIDDHAEGLLESTLTFIRSAWLDQPGSNNALTLIGVARFIFTCQGHPAWSKDEAILRLRTFGIKAVQFEAKAVAKAVKAGVQGKEARFAWAMQEGYNNYRGKGQRTLEPIRGWEIAPPPAVE